LKLAGRTTATLVYTHVALQGRHLDEGSNPGIARDIDKTPVEITKEAMLPDIMKKQSKSLTAKVVTRRCFESRRDRQDGQLDCIQIKLFFFK
jgi:hypothetical protein